MTKERERVDTGTYWEKTAGFSRAIRIGNRILIAGTTATDGNELVGKDDIAKQMDFILQRIEDVVVKLGGQLTDIIRTRIFVRDIKQWETVAKIHGEKFQTIRPVTTLVEARLVGECLVEVEAEAEVVE